MLGHRSSAERSAQEVELAVKVARRSLGSGDAVVFVDHATEAVTASDRATVGSADRMGNWLSELRATMCSRLGCSDGVLLEHRLEMSS